jgi:ectoine hydroxylase-related dioxygenase (phytanoyl-CoA dioxygenase family)
MVQQLPRRARADLNYKWLRAVGSGEFTGAHYDVVYMGRGTLNVLTCGTPLGDVPFELGGLAILRGLHNFDRVKQTYGKMDVDRDHVEGWFSNDPVELVDKFGGQWRTAEFEMGDALIFGMFTMHGSMSNMTNRFASVATRATRAPTNLPTNVGLAKPPKRITPGAARRWCRWRQRARSGECDRAMGE